MSAGTVIIGAGQAGFQTAASLRSSGYQEPVFLIGDEPHLPYQRPPLSKSMLVDGIEEEQLRFRSADFFESQGIELITGDAVREIDSAEQRIGRLRYDTLVLATGARVRRLSLPGCDTEGVFYLRDIADARSLRDALVEAEKVVVIGGGFIGLEVAASCSKLGKDVMVVEMADRLMGRAVSPIVSDYFFSLHQSNGVKVLLNGRLSHLASADGRTTAVVLEDGTTYAADVVVVGIGVEPACDLAANAGIVVDNGIKTGPDQRTSIEGILAIGDCASRPFAGTAQRLRLESVQNASAQARVAARTILGRPTQEEEVPWFWSDQFNTRLQMAGLSMGHDRQLVRGNPDSGRFSVLYTKGGRLIAIDSVDHPADHMAGRKLLKQGLPTCDDSITDPDVPLRVFLKAKTAA